MAAVSVKTIFLYWLYNGVFSLPLRQWTLHTYTRNWNDANAICQSTGAQLASPIDDPVADVFVAFMSRPPWKGQFGGLSCLVRIGRNRHTDQPEWYDCTDPLLVYGDTSSYMAEECGSLRVSKKDIATVNCFEEKREFVCEHILSSVCEYTKFAGGEPDIAFAESHTVPYSVCLGACDMLDECMAIVYDERSERCEMYETSDLLYFEDGNHITYLNEYQDAYYKTCFVASIYTNDTPLAVSPRLDPMSFDCGRTENNATTFTVYSNAKTWEDAVESCASRGQSIATISDLDTLYVLQTLDGSTSQGYYWVGFQEQLSGDVTWLSGGSVSTFSYEDPAQVNLTCGALQLELGHYQLFDCSLEMPYICQQVKDRCGYHVTASTKGVDFTYHGDVSNEECKDLCDGMQDCQVFVYTQRLPSLFPPKQCYTKTLNNWLFAFYPDFDSQMTYDSNKYMARWTCIWCCNAYAYLCDLQVCAYSLSLLYITVEIGYYTEESAPAEESATTDIPGTLMPTPTTYALEASSRELWSSEMSQYSDMSSSNQTLVSYDTYQATGVIITSSFASHELSMELTTELPSASSSNLATPVENTDSIISQGHFSQLTPSWSPSSHIVSPQGGISSSLAASFEDNIIPSTTTTAELSSSSLWNGITETTPKPPSSGGGVAGGSANSNQSGSNYAAQNGLCRCACPPNMTTVTSSESRLDDLIVPKESTHAYKITKESVYDDRPSATGIGALACVFLSAVFLLIVLSDAVTFWGFGFGFFSH